MAKMSLLGNPSAAQLFFVFFFFCHFQTVHCVTQNHEEFLNVMGSSQLFESMCCWQYILKFYFPKTLFPQKSYFSELFQALGKCLNELPNLKYTLLPMCWATQTFSPHGSWFNPLLLSPQKPHALTSETSSASWPFYLQLSISVPWFEQAS